ncbi:MULTISPECIES: riboflavin synthase [Photobacterium]|uniref:Riboflavin synthase n=1 Tax=Photobacterium ganghwense TaxID=320778 RepID=A0A0J1HIP3_9GAMM|nr:MULTISPECIES: riboflavin synthase [Photobacterium]KLV11470.1 riboflavin synthase subunit alpha [Photobacterium ganghwense]MBV1841744.1 riboflavin synthase [Photobacterium ganghwense]PSU08326.1 riboflavin synthase [Photobacterium ganghwense]
MFTGIVQSVAFIDDISDENGIQTFILKFKKGFCDGLEVGASIAVDGVCLTVTKILSETRVSLDIMLPSLETTALDRYLKGDIVNVERAAKDGAEIGGHPLSGHIDFHTPILQITRIDDNHCLRFVLCDEWKRYIFPKGYIAINGASLTVSAVNKDSGWFEVWLIPETRRTTNLEAKRVGEHVNVEIERGTQVVVDTVRDTLTENLGPLMPMFEKLLAEQGIDMNALAQPAKEQASSLPCRETS